MRAIQGATSDEIYLVVRRRSESPPPRSSVAYDQGYSNGYSGRSPAQLHRGGGTRDYPPPRGGREALDVNNGYRRP